MNYAILAQYNLKFVIVTKNKIKIGFVETTKPENTLSFDLSDFFVEGYPDGYLNTILQNINKAQNNIVFDPTDDGSPTFVSLEIGKTNCSIRNIIRGTSIHQIPTEDLKQILLSWNEFFEINKIDEVGIV